MINDFRLIRPIGVHDTHSLSIFSVQHVYLWTFPELTHAELQHRLVWILTVACRIERKRRGRSFF